MSILKRKISSGIIWSAVEKFSAQIIQFIFTIALARILAPADYGLIGMLSIFFAISQSFIDSGFSNALIQKKDRTDIDFNTTFIFNTGVGLFLYLLFFLISPFIADFYNKPILKSLTRLMALNLIINSASIIQKTKMAILMDFKTLANVSWISIIIGGIVGVILALYQLGVWALAAQNITTNLCNTLLLWISTKWQPNFRFSTESFKKLFKYGSNLLIAGQIYTVFENLYFMIIGKFYSANILGFYIKAKNFAQLPSQNFATIIQRVTFPVFSSLQNDKEKLYNGYRKLIRMIAFIVFPLMLTTAVIAHPTIRILLTDKWIQTAGYLQLMCFVMIFLPINEVNVNIIKTSGDSALVLRLEIVKKIVMTILLFITLKNGIISILWGQIVASIFTLLVSMYFGGKKISYNLKDQLKDIFPFLLISVCIGIFAFLTMKYIKNDFLQISYVVITTIISYSLIMFLTKNQEFKEMLSLIKRK